MSVSLRSRELFKSYGNAKDAGLPPSYIYRRNEPLKNWRDIFLLNHPSFVGDATVTSYAGRVVIVKYGPRFVTYPHGYYHINDKPVIGEFIISRQEAIDINIPWPGESENKNIPNFDGFPLDQPLQEGEFIGQSSPFSGDEILTDEDLTDPVDPQQSIVISKLDEILALLKTR